MLFLTSFEVWFLRLKKKKKLAWMDSLVKILNWIKFVSVLRKLTGMAIKTACSKKCCKKYIKFWQNQCKQFAQRMHYFCIIYTKIWTCIEIFLVDRKNMSEIGIASHSKIFLFDRKNLYQIPQTKCILYIVLYIVYWVVCMLYCMFLLKKIFGKKKFFSIEKKSILDVKNWIFLKKVFFFEKKKNCT